MKVLLINNFHYLRGGSETVYFKTGQLLKEYGHEVVWFSLSNPDNYDCEYSNFFADSGNGINRMKNYFYNRDVVEKLSALIEREKPDIAHVHLFWGGISPSLFTALKKYDVPLVHTVHDYRMICPAYTLRNGHGVICEKCKGNAYYQCVINKCCKGSLAKSLMMSLEMYWRNCRFSPLLNIDAMIYVSSFIRDMHIRFDPGFANVDNEVIYNPVKGLDNPYTDFENYFLYYGRLSSEKGVDTLLEAASLRPDISFKIVGKGPEEDNLKKKASLKGLNNVVFIGFKSGNELIDIVKNALFVIVPSEWYESLGLTVVEPYSMGRPVIAASIGGLAEIVDNNKTGFLFEPGNVSSLVQAIDLAFSLPREKVIKMGENAYDYYLCHFKEEDYIQKVVNLYNRVIEKHSE